MDGNSRGTDCSGPERDQDLVAALRAGEPAAFRTLHLRYLDRVFGYVRRRVSRSEDAEDIACEVFAAAAASLTTFRGSAGLFVWLVGIARRKVADHLRCIGRRPEIPQADLPSGELDLFAGVDWTAELPEELLQRAEVARTVRKAVALLPEAQREAMLLRHVDGASIREVSRVMGRSEDSVKALLRRGRATLVARLAPDIAGMPAPSQGVERHEETDPNAHEALSHP